MPTFNNIANHFNSIDLPSLGRFWFSYNTLVAFMPFSGSCAYKLFVHENDWGTTTGKHLNAIDGGDKSSRYNDGAFHECYRDCFSGAVLP